MKNFWATSGLCAVLALASLPLDASAQAGRWRFDSGVWAPWVTAPGGTPSGATLRGRTIEFATRRVIGPAPLACNDAGYAFVLTPAQGLFQGGLHQGADSIARTLGVTRLPVITLAVSCDAGVFDFHFVAPDRLLLALDNVIWTLSAISPSKGPEAVVQAFLIEHMTHDMAFTRESLARKQRFLSPGLAGLIADYHRQPLPQDEPPPINGDPFTDSQEYPERFSIGAVDTGKETARVRVLFRFEQRERGVDVLLRRMGGAWQVDDLRYEDGRTLRELLRAVTPHRPHGR